MHGKGQRSLHDNAIKSVAAATDNDIGITLSKPTKENKYVNTDQVQTRSIATEVTEENLGLYTEREAEIDAQHFLIGALKERMCYLEAELKESALETEMSRLKLELHAAGARNRADKACSARPCTESKSIEARPHTTSQGVGNHTELQDASTGKETEVKTVGVSCYGPELKSVCTGPDEPMSHWEVRERVETMEKGVGIHISTNTQGVGNAIKLCDAETNTEIPVENLGSKKSQMKYRSVGCGDCSVDVMLVSVPTQNPVQCLALPNTSHAFNTDSSTNTVLSTQDKHTNTTPTFTRTVSVGNGVKDIKCTPETRTIGVGPENIQGSALNQTTGTAAKLTRDAGVGFTNINDHFLIGLKSRNMASGPSHLPDPIKTRSIGVGEGRLQDLSVSCSAPGQMIQRSSPSQWGPELNHYIEKMQWLLREHGDLLTDGQPQSREGCVPQPSSQGSANSKLSCNNETAAQGETEVHPLGPQPSVGGEGEKNDTDVGTPGILSSARQVILSRCAVCNEEQNGDQGCSSTRKSMKFMRVTTGLDPMSSYECCASEHANSEEVEKRGNTNSRETSQDGTQGRKGKGGSNTGSKGTPTPHSQRLSEKMFSACQALKMHLSDDPPLPSRESHDCLQTIGQEWFSASSHKSATPDSMDDYLSAFRVISPSVLRHIANMADGNGNTALHYSVSHSHFAIVKKLLDAEVCNVDHQNKAGYTPIMLAALAAVESPEELRVVEQLFTKGDVNAKASQAGQTALMLAVSHGRTDMVRALLDRGADVNLQDDEGSTALMCSSEHGHAHIVRLLLAQDHCDATLNDSDDSTALSIALEAGHHDIAVLLYAHANFSKGQTGAAARHSSRSLSSSGGRNIFE
ncbi:hypothetical protein KUCAC02_008551 [Chaenocephalus aceratus]|uniref:Uncharacterized protein n=1 Tax=Chaenocephalus aceratus TaxID=36190 RepID=A0ACB9WSE2_CHAAC|nr:hypothetical protein KUCAC02_008551 [Chaenocephalus aceratus]